MTLNGNSPRIWFMSVYVEDVVNRSTKPSELFQTLPSFLKLLLSCFIKTIPNCKTKYPMDNINPFDWNMNGNDHRNHSHQAVLHEQLDVVRGSSTSLSC